MLSWKFGRGSPSGFEYILNEHLSKFVKLRNKPVTVIEKKKSCILFLKYIGQACCADISNLDAGMAYIH